MEEFALCWNKLKFAENLSSGFQSLFDRGDFVDCTIACDGQLLQCHKLVLAICSPYFREIFMNNPCRHPIIILKDVTFSIMSELLQFMYQGEVNVKQAELQAFMSIAESLQIKGLATNSGNSNSNNGTNNNNNNSTSNGNNSTMRSSDAMNSSYSQFHSNNVSGGGGGGGSTANNTGVHRNHNQHQFNSAGNHTENHRQTTSTPLSTTSSIDCGNHSIKGGKHMSGESTTPQTATPSSSSSSFAQKRTIDQISEQQQQRQSQMKMKRTVHDVSDSDMNDSIDNMTSDDIFLPASMQPQVTINESPRFDVNSVKRENSNDVIRPQSPMSGNVYRNSYHSSNSMQNTSFPYFPDFTSSDLSNSNNINDLSKSHMEVPPAVLPGERWFNGKLQFMLSQRGKPLLVHDGFSFGIQYIRKDKKYWQCNLSRKYNCKARVTTTDGGDIIVTNNEHCHTEIRQHLRKDYKMNKLQAQLSSQLNHHMPFQIGDRKMNLGTYMSHAAAAAAVASSTALANCPPAISSISTTQTSIMPRQTTTTNSFPKNLSLRSESVSPPPTATPPPLLPPQRRDSNDSPSKCSSRD
ncbi:longitudinals lacking protein, isoforms H/M/V-like isoform X4 [Chironomus tepperi]|uniref:longitudinals lacking protein, isoforms H/M/V-like isoform X4 n=1 Tax=Chironomus tepperi TaxID=113505 RepID=UPI00391FC513